MDGVSDTFKLLLDKIQELEADKNTLVQCNSEMQNIVALTHRNNPEIASNDIEVVTNFSKISKEKDQLYNQLKKEYLAQQDKLLAKENLIKSQKEDIQN